MEGIKQKILNQVETIAELLQSKLDALVDNGSLKPKDRSALLDEAAVLVGVERALVDLFHDYWSYDEEDDWDEDTKFELTNQPDKRPPGKLFKLIPGEKEGPDEDSESS